ncbi:MAG: UDP-N-acetylmuramoyl-L-alanyl-D-glutamate--2,6-diaminopimelate ligase, partial [Kiritimatiellae bacterium]|nr:UDP-N-acetylmuramoyl-L-alanyl-D-glutamate--2,6-diaminopimelate ligase [Kiritimatiellia bacterium]
ASDNLDIGGVCCDSRKARAGDIFVAIRGTRDEGLRHIEQAAARGIAAVVAETAPPPSGVSWVQVRDARAAVALLACAANGHPSRSMSVYAVTGTNGKTTTAWLTRDVLAAAGRKTGLISTVQYAYGERAIAASRTTPDACELQELLAAMRNDGCAAAVMEASSHALDQQRIGGLRLAAAAFTNLSRDHLDYHHDFDAYFAAKLRLFEQLSSGNPGGAAIVNADDAYGQRLLERLPALGLRALPFGFRPEAAIRAEDIRLDAAGSRFRMITPAGETEIAAHLMGRFNIANMLCATGLALAAEVPLATIAGVLREAQPRWGRLEQVPTLLPATVFVDYAHTDDALEKTLTALREITRGRLIAVFGCGGDRDRAKRPMMGRVVAVLADLAIVTSDNPRTEEPQAIIAEIVAGIPAGREYIVEPDRRAAILTALKLAKAGDVILIAGKGHETYQEYAHRVVPFDDREQVRSLARDVR